MTKGTWIMIGVALVALFALPVATVGTVIFVAQPLRIEGTAMLPTYKDGDRVMVEKVTREFERGDVVVFWYPKDQSKSFIKRVVGLPGERIEIRNNRVYVDGERLAEPYVAPEYSQFHQADLTKVVPEGHVFVMGDNRDQSNDSRTWGTLPVELIYGRVWFQYG